MITLFIAGLLSLTGRADQRPPARTDSIVAERLVKHEPHQHATSLMVGRDKFIHIAAGESTAMLGEWFDRFF